MYTLAPPRAWALLRKFGRGCLHGVNVGCALHLFRDCVGGPSPVSCSRQLWVHIFRFMTSIQMDGVSMLPTFDATGEIIIEDILSHRLFSHTLARGQLVTLQSPLQPNRVICKRVIGLPGDTICVDPTGLMAPSTEHVIVPKGHVWIAGDNASCSRDSRLYGPVPTALIRGKVIARVYPFNRFRIFSPEATFID
ncbi:LexA/Signal peptidase [Scleroderma citrinum]